VETGWLEVFRAVADTGSFTAAAGQLGYTQSAVSRQIAALETDLGAVLFDRLPRGARLTEAGRRLIDHTGPVLDRLDTARRELSDLRDLSAGQLRLGAFPTADADLVPRALAEFRARHPEIEVFHRDGLTAELVAALRSGDLDLAVINGYPDRIATLDGIELVHLWDEPILVALPPGHRMANRRTVRLAELAGEDWIAASTDPRETLISAFLRQDFRPTIAYTIADWTAKLGFVAAGLGITLLPALGATGVRPDLRLVSLHRDDAPVRGVYAGTVGSTDSATAFVPYLRRAVRVLNRALSERQRQPE